MNDVINEFVAAMAEHGVALEDHTEVIADDQVRRLRAVGDSRGKTSVSYQLDIDASGFGFGWFVAWKMGEGVIRWHSKPKRGEVRVVQKLSRQWHIDRDKERARITAEKKKMAVDDTRVVLEQSEPAAGHPYLLSKGVEWDSLRQHEGCILVPLTDGNSIQGCQLIAGNGRRWFIDGSDKKGHWFLISKDEDSFDRVFITEGLSTGLSVRDVSGCPVFVAIDAGNMKPVAINVRKLHPNAQIIIAGDNDLWTRDAKGQPVNPGVRAAEQAAVASQSHIWIPEGLEHPDTDWNDAVSSKGVEWVKDQLDRIPPITIPDDQEYDEEHPLEVLDSLVNPLGHDGDKLYFLPKRIGKVIELDTSKVKSITNLILLASLDDYRRILGVDTDNDREITDIVSKQLTDMCVRKGPYEPARVFGAGAWREGKEVILNTGDGVYSKSKGVMHHADVKGNGFYVRSAKRYDVDCEPLSDSESAKLLDLCGMLNWKRPVNGTLLAGWIVIAPVGGALTWRPHVFLTGSAGAGKSTVVDRIVTRMLENASIRMDGGSTEAGLRANIGDSSLPIIMDEFETENKSDANNAQKILTWARKASSGGVIVNANGSYRAQSCVFFSAINPALSQRADIDRSTVLEMIPNNRPTRREEYEALLEEIHVTITTEYSNRMIKRTIDNIDSLLHNCDVFSRQASRILGSQRAGDQVGPMLAGAYLLSSTDKISDEDARNWCNAQDWTWHSETQDGSDSERLIQRIMTSMIDVTLLDRNVRITIEDLISRVIDDDSSSPDAAKALGRVGLAVKDEMLCIANNSSRLSDLLIGTAWVNYRPSLSRYPEAKSSESNMWFTGGTGTQRYITIPLASITQNVSQGLDDEEQPF